MKFKLLVVIVSILITCFYFSLKEYNKKNNKKSLIVGISADFPPFSFIKDEEYVGFDIDLMMAIGQQLNKDIKFKNMSFMSLLPALQLEQIDMVIGGLTPNLERQKKIFFSNTYIDNDYFVIVGLKENHKDNLNELTGQKIVVNTGYSSERYIDSLHSSSFFVQRLKTPADAICALKNNIADAFITAYSSVIGLVKNNEFYVTRIDGTVESAAIGINKDNDILQENINGILKQFKEDGTLRALRKKWNINYND